MRAERPRVLIRPADAVLLGHAFGRLPHAFTRGGLGDLGEVRHQIPGPDLGQGTDPGAERLRLGGSDQLLREGLLDGDRNVRERFGTPGDDDIGVATLDEIGSVRDRLIGGGTGPGNRHGGYGLGQRGQPDFAGDVGGVGIMHDGPVDQVIHVLATDSASVHELTHRQHAQVDRGQVFEDGPGPDERRAASGDDGGASGHGPL